MSATVSNTLADRFAWWIECLFKALALHGHRRRIDASLGPAIAQRIFALCKRLKAALAKWRDGTLGPPRMRAARERTVPAEELPRPKSVLPRGFGWLHRLIPELQEFAGGLWYLLTDLEMKEILAIAAQVGRILRPLARIMGTPLPPELELPKRVRVRKKKEPLPPHPLAARFPDTPAARSAARVLARMQAGLPVDVTRLSAVAYGYFVHPPRDDNCPPPEIGYARARPPPKDYEPAREEAEPPPATAPPAPAPVEAQKPRERGTFFWPLRREI
jgi:hypothetical protein